MYDTHLKQICVFELKMLFFFQPHCLEATRGALDGFISVLVRFASSLSLSVLNRCIPIEIRK